MAKRERAIYEKDRFISKAVNLLAAGAAWKSGKLRFHSNDQSARNFSTSIDENDLREIAKDLIIDGESSGYYNLGRQSIILRKDVERGEKNIGWKRINFKYKESGLIDDNRSILSIALVNYDAYENLLGSIKNLITDPTQQQENTTLFFNMFVDLKSHIEFTLGIPEWAIDQHAVDKKSGLEIAGGLMGYTYNVNSLRNSIEYQIMDGIETDLLKIIDFKTKHLSWAWNKEWSSGTMCKYGLVYQIFYSSGIDLLPLKAYELQALETLAANGLSSKKMLDDCKDSYSID